MLQWYFSSRRFAVCFFFFFSLYIIFFCRSADVYNVMVFSGKLCWRHNVTAAKRHRTKTINPWVPTTRTTNRWTSWAAAIPTRRFPRTITITTNLTNPVSWWHCNAMLTYYNICDVFIFQLYYVYTCYNVCKSRLFTGSWFSGLADGSLLLEDAMRRRLAGHPALHHAAFLQHHHQQQAHLQEMDSEQDSSCSESGRDRMNSPSDKESAGPSGKTHVWIVMNYYIISQS